MERLSHLMIGRLQTGRGDIDVIHRRRGPCSVNASQWLFDFFVSQREYQTDTETLRLIFAGGACVALWVMQLADRDKPQHGERKSDLLP